KPNKRQISSEVSTQKLIRVNDVSYSDFLYPQSCLSFKIYFALFRSYHKITKKKKEKRKKENILHYYFRNYKSLNITLHSPKEYKRKKFGTSTTSKVIAYFCFVMSPTYQTLLWV
ncbi:hypothetical protein PanWU01x14_117340, partial [Parasponia andersonii]